MSDSEQAPPPPPPTPIRGPEPPGELAPSSQELSGTLAMADVELAASQSEPEDRFRTWVATAIAIVSVLGAVVAFTATLAEQSARQLDQQGIEDASRQQQIVTDLQATVNANLRYLAPYQEHIKAAQMLDSQANTLAATDATNASLLHAQAESERVLARSWQALFQAAFPTVSADLGTPMKYDANAALRRLEARNPDLQELRPDAVLAQAAAKHSESVNLIGLVTLFVASLLFLTLAQFTRPSIRRTFAAAGGLVAVGSVILWVMVLRSGP